MAFRIGDYVHSGELRNSRRNSIVGWINFGDEIGLRLELTGNLPGEFSGKDFRFTVPQTPSRSDEFNQSIDAMETLQAGVIGEVVLRIAKVPTCSAEELRQRLEAHLPLECREIPLLYLEWYSQNGRVVAEIVDPKIEWIGADEELSLADVQPDPLPDPADWPADIGPEIVAFTQNEHGFIEEFPLNESGEEAVDDDDPYQLFPPDFERQIANAQNDENVPTVAAKFFDNADEGHQQERDWADVIPGIDPETKELYEQWDEILHGQNHEPVTTLFDPPIAMPPPDSLTEEQAAAHLKIILSRLAEFCISIDMCQHATALSTYRWLLDDILPEARFTPASLGSGFIQGYSTYESCPQCEAEFDAEWNARQQTSKERSKDTDDDDVPW